MNNENFYEKLGSYFVSEDESQTAYYVNNNINSKLFNRLRSQPRANKFARL